MISINNGQAGKACFDFALEVATSFDNIVTNNPQYTLTDDTLITNYYNHVLNNAKYQTYWNKAINTNPNQKTPTALTSPVLSSKFAMGFLTILPLPVAPLPLVTVFFITYVVEKRNTKPCPLNHFTPASRKHCVGQIVGSLLQKRT